MEQTHNETNAELQGILDNLSSTVKPQDDFFRYVNGPWLDTYQLPEDRPRFGSFDQLIEDSEEHVHDILDNSPETAPKSAGLYHAYLDKQAREAAGITPIRAQLDALEAASNKEELTRVLGKLNVSDGPLPFEFFVDADPKDPETNALVMEQGGLGLPNESYYREDNFASVRAAYPVMLGKFFALSGDASDEEEGRKLGQRVLDLETKIAAHHWDNVRTRDVNATYNKLGLAEVEKALTNFNLSAWLDAWQQEFDSSSVASAFHVDIHKAFDGAIVSEPSFLEGFDQVWQEASLEDLKLIFKAHLLIHWSAYLTEELDQIHFDFYGTTLFGTSKQREPWRRAIRLIDGICGEEIGKEYAKRYFPASSKERMEKLVADLISAYRVSISGSTWLGEETKKKALDKLDLFTPMIGYTERWRDYSALDLQDSYSLMENMFNAAQWSNGYNLSRVGQPVDKGEWLMNPQTVNAYYNPTTNVIVFPAAILQPPFFHPDADDATNYGAIGAVIGHEIGHGFDDQGSEFDGHGKLTSWWTEQDHENFKTRTADLIDEYNHFTPLVVARKYEEEGKADGMPHVNGGFTTGENIGDLSGVNISLKALAISAGAQNDSREEMDKAFEKLGVISGKSALERYFLSYAHIWREKTTEGYAEQMLQIDPHSPAEFRVNGIVANVDRFYETFNVQPSDALYIEPDKRVRIW